MSGPTTRWNRPPGASIFEPGSASESRLLGKGCSAYRSGGGSTRALGGFAKHNKSYMAHFSSRRVRPL
jgi:hypothetical protein